MSNIGFATLQVIPSLKGLEASIAGSLAPAQGIASAQGAKAGQSFGGRFGSQFKKMLPSSFQGLNFGPLFGGAIAAGLVVGLAEVGGAVGKMRRIIAQESGATGDQLTKLFDTAKREATKVPASFEDIALAVSELSRRGVPLGAAFDKLAEQELFLAKITGTDLASNVEATTGLFAKFNIPLKDQSRELDVLFKATQKSGKGLNELIEPLVKGGTNLQQFGFDLDHSIALIAGLSRAGVSVQPVLASLRKAFGQIAKEGKDPQTVLRGIVKELRDGKNPTKAMADAIKLFGNRGGAELARAIQQGKFSVDGLLKSITDGKGGIIETGEATLTLADRFTLLKNKAAIALAPLGAQIRTVFSDIVTKATPAVSELFSGIANAASGLLPVLAPIGIAAAGLFTAALPLMQLFAEGLNAVGDALHAIPTPVLAVAGAVGALALGFAALKLALVTGAITSFLADLNPVTAGLVVAAAAITAIGAIAHAFGGRARAAKKEAKELGKALFDASTDAGFFAAGITDAASGVRKFLDAQIKAGNADSLQKTLLASGTNVKTLSSHLSDGAKDWNKYAEGVSKASISGIDFATDVVGMNQQLDATRSILDRQRKAFVKTSADQLRLRVSTGELTNAQVHQLKETNRNADGTVNWSRVLDATNVKLKSLAEQTQRTAQEAAEANPIYSALVNQLAGGAISAEDFSQVLQQKFKFSAEQAKAATENLGAQIKQLGGEIDKAFPAASEAAKDLKVNVIRASDDVTARQALFADQLKVSAAIGGGATKQMSNDISTNLRHIEDDFKVLAANKDPQKFTANLLRQARNIARFFDNLHTLIAQGFPTLARQLLELGVQGGANLAAGFANSKSRAAAGEAAAKIVNQAKINARQQGLSDFSAYQGIGKLLPKGVAEGITDKTSTTKVATAVDSMGVVVRERFGLGRFYDDAKVAGEQIPAGVAAGIVSNTPFLMGEVTRMIDGVKTAMRGQFRITSPSKWARDVIGKNIVRGVGLGLNPRSLNGPLSRFISHVKNGLRPSDISIPARARGAQLQSTIPTSGTSFVGGRQLIVNFNAPVYGDRALKQVAYDQALRALRANHVPVIPGANTAA